tara:strand:+ start:34573 stop:34866 length:294 start_codon:yes stop_codon:yes gene_type:complete
MVAHWCEIAVAAAWADYGGDDQPDLFAEDYIRLVIYCRAVRASWEWQLITSNIDANNDEHKRLQMADNFYHTNGGWDKNRQHDRRLKKQREMIGQPT